jgi:hypothetical protein
MCVVLNGRMASRISRPHSTEFSLSSAFRLQLLHRFPSTGTGAHWR